MIKAPRFNYIITIHNKAELIERVIMSVLICCREGSHIYAVLDGCTDGTEKNIDNLMKTFANVPITKVYTPDVHEIISINAGLQAASQEGEGYNIILQDDVLLADFMLEEKVARLYEWAGADLGFVSFRLGANFTEDAATSNELAPFTDFVENAYGHGLPHANVLLPGYIAYRSLPIKSPVCIPFSLVRSVGLLEDRLAPYMYDDIEYAVRCIRSGYRNAVFPLRFYSDVKWGTTRTKPDPKMTEIQNRNMELIRDLHGLDIAKIAANKEESNIIVELPNLFYENDQTSALKVWEENKEKYYINNLSIKAKIKLHLERIWPKI